MWDISSDGTWIRSCCLLYRPLARPPQSSNDCHAVLQGFSQINLKIELGTLQAKHSLVWQSLPQYSGHQYWTADGQLFNLYHCGRARNPLWLWLPPTPNMQHVLLEYLLGMGTILGASMLETRNVPSGEAEPHTPMKIAWGSFCGIAQSEGRPSLLLSHSGLSLYSNRHCAYYYIGRDPRCSSDKLSPPSDCNWVAPKNALQLLGSVPKCLAMPQEVALQPLTSSHITAWGKCPLHENIFLIRIIVTHTLILDVWKYVIFSVQMAMDDKEDKSEKRQMFCFIQVRSDKKQHTNRA